MIDLRTFRERHGEPDRIEAGPGTWTALAASLPATNHGAGRFTLDLDGVPVEHNGRMGDHYLDVIRGDTRERVYGFAAAHLHGGELHTVPA